MKILHASATRIRSVLGLDWLQEARDIAEAARRQREEDEARYNHDARELSRWLQEPKGYRRPAPEGGRRYEP